jgi:hypothetical protein
MEHTPYDCAWTKHEEHLCTPLAQVLHKERRVEWSVRHVDLL